MAGAGEQLVGERVAAQQLEQRVDPLVERVDGGPELAPPRDVLAHGVSSGPTIGASITGASAAAFDGSPPNSGHQRWYAQ